jgi:type III secretory pathway component EscR
VKTQAKESIDKIDELEFDLDEMKKDTKVIDIENQQQKEFLIKTIKENEKELFSEAEQNKTKREKNRNSWFNRIVKTLFG